MPRLLVFCRRWPIATSVLPLAHCLPPLPAAEPDRAVTPTSRSPLSSPLEQSFTVGGRNHHHHHYQRGRGSLDLPRPGARRGLEMRFGACGSGANGGSGAASSKSSSNAGGYHPQPLGRFASWYATQPRIVLTPSGTGHPCPAGTPRASPSPSALHRITERPTQEGRTLQQEIEAALGPSFEQLMDEVVAEEEARNSSSNCASRQQSPELVETTAEGEAASPAVVVEATSKPHALELLPRSSRSPSGSPGIQAVRPGELTGSAEEAPAVAGQPEEGQEPLQQQQREEAAGASGAEHLAGLPNSPFASVAAQALPLRRTSSSSSGAAQRALLLPVKDGQQVQQQQVQQRQQAVRVPPRQQTSEDDEGEDVYARFSSYEEMVAHFQRQAAAEDDQAAAAADYHQQLQRALHSRSSSLRLQDPSGEFTVTAASSFSGRQGPCCSGQGFACMGGCVLPAAAMRGIRSSLSTLLCPHQPTIFQAGAAASGRLHCLPELMGPALCALC